MTGAVAIALSAGAMWSYSGLVAAKLWGFACRLRT